MITSALTVHLIIRNHPASVKIGLQRCCKNKRREYKKSIKMRGEIETRPQIVGIRPICLASSRGSKSFWLADNIL